MMKRMVHEGSSVGEVKSSGDVMAPDGPMTAVLDGRPATDQAGRPSSPSPRPRMARAATSAAGVKRFVAAHADDVVANRQAELFYLQKQIQLQTQMIFVMEDGARVQGVIEWYDRHTIKVRGKARVLIYKAAIKYLYKAGEMGSTPGE